MISDNGGFTLIEFLIAMVILMVGLLGMLQGINVAMDKSVESVLRNEAIMVADDRMMVKRSKTFDALSSPLTSTLSLQRAFRGGFKNYSVTEVVSDAVGVSPNASTKQIMVDVRWKYRNIKKSHSVSSFVSISPK